MTGRRPTWSTIVPAAMVFACAAAADEPLLESGAYEVEVRLELPHLDDMGAKSVATVCVTGPEGAAHRGLAVLSENNPLGKCPVSNVAREGDALTFDIACPGGNAAVASAKYVLGPQAFRGRIAMKMGGKNMTMTETQVGRRVGDCAETGPP